MTDPKGIAPLPDEVTTEQHDIERVIATTHACMMCGPDIGITRDMTASDIRAVACTALGVDVTDRSPDYIHGRFDALVASGVRLPRHDPIPAPRARRT